MDLPVQRDIFDYPCIYSSSLKGATRSYFSLKAKEIKCQQQRIDIEKYINSVFGSPNGSGGYSFLDGYLLVIPARKKRGIVIGVTSPFLIERFYKYYNIFRDRPINEIEDIAINDGEYILLIGKEDLNEEVVVNEIKFKKSNTELPEYYKKTFIELFKEKLGVILPYKHVIIINDDIFKDLILPRSMMIVTRVQLNPDTKKVSSGPWTEEYVPQGTIFYSFIYKNLWNIGDQDFKSLVSKFGYSCNVLLLNLGGNETIGRGMVFMEVL